MKPGPESLRGVETRALAIDSAGARHHNRRVRILALATGAALGYAAREAVAKSKEETRPGRVGMLSFILGAVLGYLAQWGWVKRGRGSDAQLWSTSERESGDVILPSAGVAEAAAAAQPQPAMTREPGVEGPIREPGLGREPGTAPREPETGEGRPGSVRADE